ncbi:hypothetical protein L6R50_00680 [Myxococcota bacterium]|nr:hypothetical protein [Myxococcota bacterium]
MSREDRESGPPTHAAGSRDGPPVGGVFWSSRAHRDPLMLVVLRPPTPPCGLLLAAPLDPSPEMASGFDFVLGGRDGIAMPARVGVTRRAWLPPDRLDRLAPVGALLPPVVEALLKVLEAVEAVDAGAVTPAQALLDLGGVGERVGGPYLPALHAEAAAWEREAMRRLSSHRRRPSRRARSS